MDEENNNVIGIIKYIDIGIFTINDNITVKCDRGVDSTRTMGMRKVKLLSILKARRTKS